MADRGGIQLLPETRKKIEIKVPGENRLITIGFMLLIAVMALYAGLTWYVGTLNAKLAELSATANQLNDQRLKTKDTNQELVSLHKQSGLISKLLSNHIFWTKALVNLENAVVPQVRLKAYLASSLKGEVSLQALAPSYTVIARQLAAFAADDALVDINLKNAKTSPGGGYEFNLDLKFDPDKFLKKTQ